MKRGSIELARRLCADINGDEEDWEGLNYGSVDIAEILSAEVERLRECINSAPVAIMDNGHRVRLILDEGNDKL